METKLRLAAALALVTATFGSFMEIALAKSVAPNPTRTDFGHQLKVDAAALADVSPGRAVSAPTPNVALTQANSPAALATPSLPRKRYPHARGVYTDAPMAEVLGSAIF